MQYYVIYILGNIQFSRFYEILTFDIQIYILIQNMNIASIFQQFRGSDTTQINQLLKQSDTTISKLLDEQNIINQFRTSNPNLEKFMNYSNYQKLVQYITIVGPSDQKNRSYRYPYIAADILCIENETLLEYMLSTKQLFVEEIIEQEVQVQKEIDSLGSEASFTSDFGVDVSEGSQDLDKLQIRLQKDNLLQKENLQEKDPYDSDEKIDSPKKKDPSQISPDDFPEAMQPKRKIKVQQKITKKIKKKVMPIINYLFQFFYRPMNYILAGYVCKVLLYYFQKHQTKFCQHFFKYEGKYSLQSKQNGKQKHIMQLLHFHILKCIQSQSVEDLLLRILCLNSSMYLTQRQQMCWLVLNTILLSNDHCTISSCSNLLIQLIHKITTKPENLKANPLPTNNTLINLQKQIPISNQLKQKMRKDIFSIDFFKKIADIEVGMNELSVAPAGKLLIAYMMHLPVPTINDPENLLAYERVVQKIIEQTSSEITFQEEYYNQNQKKLGIERLTLIQCSSFIICSNVASIRNNLLTFDHKFFQKLMALFQKYPLNNVLHNYLTKIIISYLEQGKDSEIYKTSIINLLDELYKLLNSAMTHFQKNSKRKEYMGHCQKIIHSIMKHKTSNQQLLNYIQQSQPWNLLIQRYIKFNNQTLHNHLGGLIRKPHSTTIMFDKDQILQHYANFLNGKSRKSINVDDFQFPDDDNLDTHQQGQVASQMLDAVQQQLQSSQNGKQQSKNSNNKILKQKPGNTKQKDNSPQNYNKVGQQMMEEQNANSKVIQHKIQ